MIPPVIINPKLQSFLDGQSKFAIICDLPFDEYAAAPCINAGLLKKIDKTSLMHAKAMIDGKIIRDSDALDFGKSFHAMLLEGKQEFVIHPLTYPGDPIGKPKFPGQKIDKPWNWTANYCKDWAKEQAKDILSHGESDDLMAMIESVRSDEMLASYMKDAKTEVSIFAEQNGVKFKARIDTLPLTGAIIDFKSTTNARPEKFTRTIYDNGYFLQAAFYLDILNLCGDKRKDFWFVGIEKTYPYAHCTVSLFDEFSSFISAGRKRYKAALRLLLEAQKTNQWPAYGLIHGEEHATSWMKLEIDRAD